MTFKLPPTPGPSLVWDKRALFRDLAACMGLSMAKLAEKVEISKQTFALYHSPGGLTLPKESAIGKLLELVDEKVDQIIAIGRSLEAENPLTEEKFSKRLIRRFHQSTMISPRSARVRVPGRSFFVNSITVTQGREASVELNLRKNAGGHYKQDYLRVLQDAGPVIIDGELLPDDHRQRLKTLLVWTVAGLNIPRQQLADSMGLHRVSIDSWMGKGYAVTPPPTVVDDLVRMYVNWAVVTRDLLDDGAILFPPPELPKSHVFLYPPLEPDLEWDRQHEQNRLPSLEKRIADKKKAKEAGN